MQSPMLMVYDIWLALLAFWLLAALVGKRAVRRQSARARLPQVLLGALAFLLGLAPEFAVGPLAWRFWKPNIAVSWAGVSLVVVGALLASWARVILGRNWSSDVTVKERHQLVVRGPYRMVRHPIYTGLSCAMLGTALVLGQVRGALAVVLMVIAWRLKWGVEEQFMLQEFGPHYAEYRARVRALIPGIW